jgi:hypothetical protein
MMLYVISSAITTSLIAGKMIYNYFKYFGKNTLRISTVLKLLTILYVYKAVRRISWQLIHPPPSLLTENPALEFAGLTLKKI